MTSHFLLVEPNGSAPLMGDSREVERRIAVAAALADRRTDDYGRTILDFDSLAVSRLDAMFSDAVSDMREEVRRMPGGRRRDDFSAALGAGIQPRDLTHKMRRILEEKHRPLNALRVFPISTEIPAGMMRYEQHRTYSTGEAIVYRGGTGSDIPSVGLGSATVSASVVYLVAKADINWLEQLATNQLGLDTQARKMRAARLAVDQLINRWAFEGSEAHGLLGLLNHPYIDTALSTVAYTDDSTADDIASDFGVWANYAENESGSTFQPNCLQIAPKMANYLRNRRYGDNADKSLMDWILGANPHITKVEMVRELNDAGGAGIHAMAFTRIGNGPVDSSLQLEVPMTPTLLPPDRRALATEMYLVAAFAGLNQTEAGDNLVVYVQGAA